MTMLGVGAFLSGGCCAGCFLDLEGLKIELSCAANKSCAPAALPGLATAAMARAMPIPFPAGSLNHAPKLKDVMSTALHCRRFRAWMGA